MIRRLAAAAAWALLAYILFVTWSPIDLRPETGHVFLERFAAYAILGGAFAIGYPRRLRWVIAIAVLAAVVGEAGQALIAGRHARLIDGAEKLLGALTGVTFARLSEAVVERYVFDKSSSQAR